MHQETLKFQEVSVSELMQKYPQTIPVFIKHKMLCVGCTIAPYHSITEACEEHDLDEMTIHRELNAVISLDQ